MTYLSVLLSLVTRKSLKTRDTKSNFDPTILKHFDQCLTTRQPLAILKPSGVPLYDEFDVRIREIGQQCEGAMTCPRKFPPV